MGINKNSQQSSSSNQAFPWLKDQLGSSVSAVPSSITGIGDLLKGNASGFNAYKGATGFNQELSRGLQGLTGVAAARGLLRSGAAGKSFMNYGQELENRTAGTYLQNLLGMGQLGLGAAGVIGGAGQTSQSSGKGKGLSLNPVGGWGG